MNSTETPRSRSAFTAVIAWWWPLSSTRQPAEIIKRWSAEMPNFSRQAARSRGWYREVSTPLGIVTVRRASTPKSRAKRRNRSETVITREARRNAQLIAIRLNGLLPWYISLPRKVTVKGQPNTIESRAAAVASGWPK